MEQENGAVATIDDVMQSVATLSQAVADMNENRVDRSTVEAIVQDAVGQAQQVQGGYQPESLLLDEQGNPIDVEREVLGRTPADRMRAMVDLPVRDVAAVLNRDVEVIEHFRQASDHLVILSTILGAQGKISDPRELSFYGSHYAPAMNAAMDTQTATEGLEWVPRDLSSSLIERINLELKVLDLFAEISMPTNPYDIPALAVARKRLGRGVENTADTGQTTVKKITPNTRKATLTAAKFWGEGLISKEATEDSLIPALATLEDELIDYLSADLEDTAQNGDAQGAHRDSDSNSSDDPRKNWDGLRQIAAANSAQRDHGGGDLSAAGLRLNRKLMGKYGVDPSNLAHIIGMGPYIDLLSDSNLQTVDKYGANATLLSGELARVDGVPIIVSEYARGDLNATGVYDGATTTRSVAITAHKKSLFRGVRRGVTVEYLRELYSEADQDAIKVSTRQALAERYSGEKTIAASYNVDAT